MMQSSEYPPLPPVLDRLARKLNRTQDYVRTFARWLNEESNRQVVADMISKMEDKPSPDPSLRETNVGDWIYLFRSMEDRARRTQLHNQRNGGT